MVVWHRGQANIATPGGGWIFERQPGHTNTGSICPTACRASGGDICEPGTGPRDNFVVKGILDDAGKFLKVPPRCSPRDARPNRKCTPDPRRPCESDAWFREGRPRLCLLCANRFSADSVGVDTGRVPRPRPNARVSCDSSCQGTRIERIGIMIGILCVAPPAAQPEDLRIKPNNTWTTVREGSYTESARAR